MEEMEGRPLEEKCEGSAVPKGGAAKMKSCEGSNEKLKACARLFLTLFALFKLLPLVSTATSKTQKQM